MPSKSVATITLTIEPDVLALLQRLPVAIERGVQGGVLSRADAELLAELLQRALKVV